MTVSLYTGHPGSGKSYEVVKSVILPALEKGRPVVSNIDGLDVDRIREFLETQGCERPGDLLIVEKVEIQRQDFFPKKQPDGSYVPSQFVPLGALVVIDEAPAVWGSDKSIAAPHLEFFREHRHVVGEDGTACDLVVVAQTVPDVHRSLRGLCEFSVDCRRLAALGLNRKYTVTTYTGARRTKASVMARTTRSYDKRVFPLYRSFASTAGGKIVLTDRRFTIWSSKLFWLAVICAPVVFAGSMWTLYRNFFGAHGTVAMAQAAGVTVPSIGGQVVAPVGSPAAPPPAAQKTPPQIPERKTDIGGESNGPVSVWRVAGSATFGGRQWVVLRRTGFPLRYMPLSFCLVSFGRVVSCHIGSEVFEPEGVAERGSGPPPGGPVWAPDAAASLVRKP